MTWCHCQSPGARVVTWLLLPFLFSTKIFVQIKKLLFSFSWFLVCIQKIINMLFILRFTYYTTVCTFPVSALKILIQLIQWTGKNFTNVTSVFVTSSVISMKKSHWYIGTICISNCPCNAIVLDTIDTMCTSMGNEWIMEKFYSHNLSLLIVHWWYLYQVHVQGLESDAGHFCSGDYFYDCIKHNWWLMDSSSVGIGWVILRYKKSVLKTRERDSVYTCV